MEKQKVPILYTSKHCAERSQAIRKALVERGFPFQEVDIDNNPGRPFLNDVSNEILTQHVHEDAASVSRVPSSPPLSKKTIPPELRNGLIQRIGDGITFPGIEFDSVWISDSSMIDTNLNRDDSNSRHQRREANSLQQLSHGNETNVNTMDSIEMKVEQAVGIPATDEANRREHLTEQTTTMWEAQQKQGKLLLRGIGPECERVESHPGNLVDKASSQESGGRTLTQSSSHGKVLLPNGSEMAISALTRLLLQATNHRCVTHCGQTYYFFRGYEGHGLWSILFFEGGSDEDDIVRFGEMLIDKGIVHNYSPNCESFQNTFLVLQPFQEPRVLNTFIKWPQGREGEPSTLTREDPMDVILRLSRAMDQVFEQDYRESPEAFHKLEEAVCELQVTPFPTNPVEKVTFALNLFNIVVRHAMIVVNERNWTWPERFEELGPFFSKLGYNVSGHWMSLADLQASLYGRSGQNFPNMVPGKCPWWRRIPCTDMTDRESGMHYQHPVTRTDPRILFATTWGVQSSPVVSTLYPNRLDEGLQTAAELYCQRHVIVCADRVVLPALLSLHRADFGSKKNAVLYSILPYLSVAQLRGVQDLRERRRLSVVFDGSVNWKQGLLPKENDMRVDHRSDHRPTSRSLGGGGAASPCFFHNHVDSFRIYDVPGRQGEKSTPRGKSIRSESPGSFEFRGAVRQPSVGESQCQPPRASPAPSKNAGISTTEASDSCDGDDDDDARNDGTVGSQDLVDDDGHSFFQSVVSEITYGSDFEYLLGTRSQRRLDM